MPNITADFLGEVHRLVTQKYSGEMSLLISTCSSFEEIDEKMTPLHQKIGVEMFGAIVEAIKELSSDELKELLEN